MDNSQNSDIERNLKWSWKNIILRENQQIQKDITNVIQEPKKADSHDSCPLSLGLTPEWRIYENTDDHSVDVDCDVFHISEFNDCNIEKKENDEDVEDQEEEPNSGAVSVQKKEAEEAKPKDPDEVEQLDANENKGDIVEYLDILNPSDRKYYVMYALVIMMVMSMAAMWIWTTWKSLKSKDMTKINEKEDRYGVVNFMGLNIDETYGMYTERSKQKLKSFQYEVKMSNHKDKTCTLFEKWNSKKRNQRKHEQFCCALDARAVVIRISEWK